MDKVLTKKMDLIHDIKTATKLCGNHIMVADNGIEVRFKGTNNTALIMAIQCKDDDTLVMILSNHKEYVITPNTLPLEILEKLYKVCVATNPDVVYERCPECENEAIIPYTMKMGVCNHCGRPLAPCAMCMDINEGKIDCSTCEFNHKNKESEPQPNVINIFVLVVPNN